MHVLGCVLVCLDGGNVRAVFDSSTSHRVLWRIGLLGGAQMA